MCLYLTCFLDSFTIIHVRGGILFSFRCTCCVFLEVFGWPLTRNSCLLHSHAALYPHCNQWPLPEDNIITKAFCVMQWFHAWAWLLHHARCVPCLNPAVQSNFALAHLFKRAREHTPSRYARLWPSIPAYKHWCDAITPIEQTRL